MQDARGIEAAAPTAAVAKADFLIKLLLFVILKKIAGSQKSEVGRNQLKILNLNPIVFYLIFFSKATIMFIKLKENP
jgi:hypothetical protein